MRRRQVFRLRLLVIVGIVSALNQNVASGFQHKRHTPSSSTNKQQLQQTNNVEAKPSETCTIQTIRRYTESALNNRGTEKGLEALSELRELCQCRIPYEFESSSDVNTSNGSVVSLFRQLMPSQATSAFLKQVQILEENEWISTNADSVDALPSLHVNLVSNGKPMKTKETEFQKGIETLLDIVHPYLYNELLPQVQRLLKSSRIRISDVFFRRYGQDICGLTRNGISAHYDVFSRVTAVVALDDVAANGRNGLYTTFINKEDGATSNHAALRRFFPLQSGDGVVHTWDILHGVDVEPGLDRTSLIIWFTEEEEEEETISETKDDIQSVAPWLLSHPESDNDVAQFVLASAKYSIDETHDASKDRLYLNSAAQGNSFALTRMGSLFDEQVLDFATQEQAMEILETLGPLESLPDPIKRFASDKKSAFAAMRFWFEGAVRGNPLSQRSLADEIMFQCSSEDEHEEDSFLLAAVLFALAAQQGDEEALNSLKRVVELDLENRNVQSREEFLQCPVVQVARAAI